MGVCKSQARDHLNTRRRTATGGRTSVDVPRSITGIVEVAEKFDALLIDVWGVLHDGGSAYPGAVDCLGRLRAADKTVVIFSNAARRMSAIAVELAAHGIKADLYDHIVSSGELVWRTLATRTHGYGRRCFWMGPVRSRSLLDGLDLEIVDSLREADFILNAGAEGNLPDATEFTPLLIEAADLGLRMLCANPDCVAIRKGVKGISAGAIASSYAALGGRVDMLGKPFLPMYANALNLPGIGNRKSVLAVGDGLQTDIRGGHDAALSTLLITGGIHYDEICEADGGLAEVCRRYGVFPDYAATRFAW